MLLYLQRAAQHAHNLGDLGARDALPAGDGTGTTVGQTGGATVAELGGKTPTAVRGTEGGIIVPDRLHENIQSGFAYWLSSWTNDPAALHTAIEAAINLSQETSKIRNDRPKMERNLA